MATATDRKAAIASFFKDDLPSAEARHKVKGILEDFM